MKSNQGISAWERRLLILFTSLILCSLLVFFIFDVLDDIKLSQLRAQYPNIAIDVFTVRLAGLNLLLPCIFIAILAAKKYVVSTALTLIYGALVATGFYVRLDGRGGFGSEGFYTDIRTEIWNKTHPFEFVAVFFIVAVLIWQGSILWRIFVSDRRNQVCDLD